MKLQCPKCKTVFQVDRDDYAAILSQVRNEEFNAELETRMALLEQQRKAEEQQRALQAQHDYEKVLAEKEKAIAAKELELASLTNAKESITETLNARKEAELMEVKAGKEAEINALKAQMQKEIADLKSQLALKDANRELEIAKVKSDIQDELNKKSGIISELEARLTNQKMSADNAIIELKNNHAALMKAKEEEIAHYKDMKSKLSTKLLGETLEKHCQNLFNRARSQGQFLTAYFEKDNDASSGTKGDFIFRDYLDGEEYISIMFEMKNEDEATLTKHRNEDFFAKLDRDRKTKNCEYAILVTMLEADNELYNEGIVDVSYRYDKMMVVRPQFFLSVIIMLSRAARRGAEKLIGMRHDLELARTQTIDVTRFEERRDQFVADFSKLVQAHIKKQDDAMAALDKAIEAAEKQAENLRKIKLTFEASRSKLVRANEKAENDFTIKKLTYGNPTMKVKFREAREAREAGNSSEE